MAYGVFRSDLMTGTDVCADLRNVMYMGAGSTKTEIENGCVVKLDSLMSATDYDLWKGVTPSKTDKLDDIVIIGSVEVMYDERKKNLDEFINEAGSVCRGYVPHKNDIYSATIDSFTLGDGVTKSAITAGYVVELADGVKPTILATASGTNTVLGKIIAVQVTKRYTYYVVEIA